MHIIIINFIRIIANDYYHYHVIFRYISEISHPAIRSVSVLATREIFGPLFVYQELPYYVLTVTKPGTKI